MKKKVIIVSIILLAFAIVVFCVSNIIKGYSNLKSRIKITEEEYVEIKFSDMYETKDTEKNVSTRFKELDGQKVKLSGYPAVQSPLDESFIYLNNQPYVTCPFCVIGDITKLEIIPVIMSDGSTIQYTENKLVIYGTLEVEEKVDSEGYTTQFRIYADKVETAISSDEDKEVQEYYSTLTEAGMIGDIQNLQINLEYISNPDYMVYYGESKQDIINGIVTEYVGYDQSLVENYGDNYSYVIYMEECPEIVKSCEPVNNEKLQNLNDELIDLYNDQIVLLKKYEKIVYECYNKELTDKEAENAYKEFVDLNEENLELYNQFTEWNNKLRE